MIERVPPACPAKTPAAGDVGSTNAPARGCSLRLPPDRLRAATTDHGHTIHVPPPKADSTQLTDERSVAEAIAPIAPTRSSLPRRRSRAGPAAPGSPKRSWPRRRPSSEKDRQSRRPAAYESGRASRRSSAAGRRCAGWPHTRGRSARHPEPRLCSGSAGMIDRSPCRLASVAVKFSRTSPTPREMTGCSAHRPIRKTAEEAPSAARLERRRQDSARRTRTRMGLSLPSA